MTLQEGEREQINPEYKKGIIAETEGTGEYHPAATALLFLDAEVLIPH